MSVDSLRPCSSVRGFNNVEEMAHVKFCMTPTASGTTIVGLFAAASISTLPHLTYRPPRISHVRLMPPKFVRSVTWCSFIADRCGAITIYQTFSSLAYCGWLSVHRWPDVVELIRCSFGTGSAVMQSCGTIRIGPCNAMCLCSEREAYASHEDRRGRRPRGARMALRDTIGKVNTERTVGLRPYDDND